MGREEEVRRRGAEVAEDLRVGTGAREDGLAGEEVGVYDGEVVRWGLEEGRDGGFAGCEGAGEADEEHGVWVYACVVVCWCMYMRARMCVCMYARVCVCVCMSVCVCMGVCVCVMV